MMTNALQARYSIVMAKRNLAHLSFSTGPGATLRPASPALLEFGRELEDARRECLEGRAMSGDESREFIRATRAQAMIDYPPIIDKA